MPYSIINYRESRYTSPSPEIAFLEIHSCVASVDNDTNPTQKRTGTMISAALECHPLVYCAKDCS